MALGQGIDEPVVVEREHWSGQPNEPGAGIVKPPSQTSTSPTTNPDASEQRNIVAPGISAALP